MRAIIARLTPALAARPLRLSPALMRSALSRFPMSLSKEDFMDISLRRIPGAPGIEGKLRRAPGPTLRLARDEFHEAVCRDHGSEEVVDALHRGRLLFRFLAGAGIADDDRKITGVAGGTRISFDAPVQMDAGKHDGLDSLAAQFQRELGSCESRLQCK